MLLLLDNKARQSGERSTLSGIRPKDARTARVGGDVLTHQAEELRGQAEEREHWGHSILAHRPFLQQSLLCAHDSFCPYISSTFILQFLLPLKSNRHLSFP